MFYLVFRTLHLIGMLLWLGAGLSFPVVADVRRSVAAGQGAALGLRERLRTTSMIVIPAALATLLSGLMLVMLRGGFGAVPVRIHLGLGLAIGVFIIGAGFTSRAMFALTRALESGDQRAAEAQAQKVATGLYLEDTLRLATLLAMAVPFENL